MEKTFVIPVMKKKEEGEDFGINSQRRIK